MRCRIPSAVSVDILLPKHKTAIFVHGCFWHRHKGCKNCTTPTHRRQWWLAKLNGNAARDQLHRAALKKLRWRSIIIWECETERPETLLHKLSRMLFKKRGGRRAGLIGGATLEILAPRKAGPSLTRDDAFQSPDR